MPKWDPKNPLPTNLEAIFGTAYDNSSITMNLPYTPLDPNTYPEIYLPQGYCGTTDAGSFSDDLEIGYHADVHSLAGGEMNTSTSPRVPLFWPWHAWVDEIWYRWERDCAGTYTIYDLSDNKITINGVVTWGSSQFVKGEIEIEDGAELIINGSNTTINMANSQYNANRTYIRVKPGGKLTINGATLTGMTRLGLNSDNDDAPTGGVFYNEMWEGIVVEAQGGLRGTVTLSNNATIEHAAIGIRSISGGRIYAEDARFYNNRISVSIESHPNIPALTQFVGCEFKNDAPLRDAIYRYYLNNGDLKLERVSNLSRTTQNHAQLLNSRGIVFHSCDFSNPYQEGAGEEHLPGDEPEHEATGISAKNSRVKVADCTFKDLRHGMYFDNSQVLVEGCEFDYQFPNPEADGINMYSSDVIVTADTRFYDLGWGIYAGNAQAGPAGILRVEQSMFYNNFQGIFLFGADYAQVKESSFYVPPMPSANEMSAGVVITGSAAFDVTQNEFFRLGTEEAYGIITDNTAEEYPNLIARNDFGAGNVPGPSYSIQVENDNSRLQMLCNDFNTYGQAQNLSDNYAMGLKNAELPNQGSFLEPTANRWDQQYYYHIEVEGSITPFNYYRYANADHAPTTNHASVNIINNSTDFDENTPNTCGANPCEGIAWPCELEKISGLEEEIGESGAWGLSPEETAQRIQELESRQEQLAIDMVRDLVLADSGYLAAQRLEELLDVLPHLSSDQSILEQRYGTGGTMGLNQSNQSLGLELQVISRETVHYIVQQTFEERKNVRLFYQPVTSHQMINAKPAQDQPPTILYPNPVKLCAYLQVNLPASESPYRLQWKDIYGREIASGLLTATVNGEYQCVAPCDAPAGYYLIQIIDDGGIVDCLPIVLMN